MPDVALSNPDKVLFPADGVHGPITKADLFDYAGRCGARTSPPS